MATPYKLFTLRKVPRFNIQVLQRQFTRETRKPCLYNVQGVGVSHSQLLASLLEHTTMGQTLHPPTIGFCASVNLVTSRGGRTGHLQRATSCWRTCRLDILHRVKQLSTRILAPPSQARVSAREMAKGRSTKLRVRILVPPRQAHIKKEPRETDQKDGGRMWSIPNGGKVTRGAKSQEGSNTENPRSSSWKRVGGEREGEGREDAGGSPGRS